MSIENLKTRDPFAEADEETGETQKPEEYIHIRIQQRNGRKTLTTIQGLPQRFDRKKILKFIKKKFACNGSVPTDPELGEVIQLQGDQRKQVREFLIEKPKTRKPKDADDADIGGLGLNPATIKVHGF